MRTELSISGRHERVLSFVTVLFLSFFFAITMIDKITYFAVVHFLRNAEMQKAELISKENAVFTLV